jgi:hypothetical protein
LLTEALLAEASVVGAQSALPAHLREAGGLVDPRAGGVEEFMQTLLAPARSGMILVRSDLSRAARTLNLGARAGERKFTLKSLLGQDAAGVLGWLAEEASAWTTRHGARRASLGAVAEWWESRALESAALLSELAAEAREDSATSEEFSE